MYHYRLCRARRYEECTFRILSSKWRTVKRSLNVSLDFAVDIVKACVLYSFVPERGRCKFEDAMTVTGIEGVPDG